MMTRRALMWSAAAAGLGGLVAACDKPDRAKPEGGRAPAGGDLLVVETAEGLAVLDSAGRPVVPGGPGLLAPLAGGLIRTAVRAGRTEVSALDVRGGRARWQAALTGGLAARVASADGRLVALATPGAEGGSPYRPAGRERTTLVVADDGGERVRLELPGNLEPEAFSADGRLLFVLDYLPPAAPDRYRVRMVDLASGRLEPLLTRLKSVVPPGAEEEMRGVGRQAVYDARRQLLFTLYTHQPEHLHTRDRLAGARPGAAHVHAFVHTLSLREHWAYCVDLPTPFGEGAPEGHAIALDRAGDRLAVVTADHGKVALVDPEGLAVVTVEDLAGPRIGEAAARFAPDGSLLVAAGRDVARVPVGGGGATGSWSCASPVRGLVPHPGGRRVLVGQEQAVTCHDLDTGRELARTPVRGLRRLCDLVPAT